MPKLKQLECSIELGTSNTKIKEYGPRYSDGHVETFIAVPETDLPFTVHLKSHGYIAPGLAAFVFMDGVYQCNRNKLGLKLPGPGVEESDYEVEFRLRQKEEKTVISGFVAREWTFTKLDKVSADKAPPLNPQFLNNVGTIEVVVCRCKADFDDTLPSRMLIPNSKPVKASAEKAAIRAAAAQGKSANESMSGLGGLLGLFDGACDYINLDGTGDRSGTTQSIVRETAPPGAHWDDIQGKWAPFSPFSHFHTHEESLKGEGSHPMDGVRQPDVSQPWGNRGRDDLTGDKYFGMQGQEKKNCKQNLREQGVDVSDSTFDGPNNPKHVRFSPKVQVQDGTPEYITRLFSVDTASPYGRDEKSREQFLADIYTYVGVMCEQPAETESLFQQQFRTVCHCLDRYNQMFDFHGQGLPPMIMPTQAEAIQYAPPSLASMIEISRALGLGAFPENMMDRLKDIEAKRNVFFQIQTQPGALSYMTHFDKLASEQRQILMDPRLKQPPQQNIDGVIAQLKAYHDEASDLVAFWENTNELSPVLDLSPIEGRLFYKNNQKQAVQEYLRDQRVMDRAVAAKRDDYLDFLDEQYRAEESRLRRTYEGNAHGLPKRLCEFLQDYEDMSEAIEETYERGHSVFELNVNCRQKQLEALSNPDLRKPSLNPNDLCDVRRMLMECRVRGSELRTLHKTLGYINKNLQHADLEARLQAVEQEERTASKLLMKLEAEDPHAQNQQPSQSRPVAGDSHNTFQGSNRQSGFQEVGGGTWMPSQQRASNANLQQAGSGTFMGGAQQMPQYGAQQYAAGPNMPQNQQFGYGAGFHNPQPGRPQGWGPSRHAGPTQIPATGPNPAGNRGWGMGSNSTYDHFQQPSFQNQGNTCGAPADKNDNNDGAWTGNANDAWGGTTNNQNDQNNRSGWRGSGAGDNNNNNGGWGTPASNKSKSSRSVGSDAQSQHSSRFAASHSSRKTRKTEPEDLIKPYWKNWNKPPTSNGGSSASSMREEPREAYIYPDQPLGPVPGKKVAKDASHGIQTGKGADYAHMTRRPTYIDNMEQPYAVFSYKYRTKDLLEKTLKIKVDNLDVKKIKQQAEKERLLNMPKAKLADELARLRMGGKKLGEIEKGGSIKTTSPGDWLAPASNKSHSAAGWSDAGSKKSGSAAGGGWGEIRPASNNGGGWGNNSNNGSGGGWGAVKPATNNNKWGGGGGGWDGTNKPVPTVQHAKAASGGIGGYDNTASNIGCFNHAASYNDAGRAQGFNSAASYNGHINTDCYPPGCGPGKGIFGGRYGMYAKDGNGGKDLNAEGGAGEQQTDEEGEINELYW